MNPAYSERAFARNLGLSPSFLKMLFQGKKNLSEERARSIALKLNWSELKRKQFLQIFQSNAAEKSKNLQGKFLLKDKDFFEISDWFHFAIVEFLKLRKRQFSDEEIAKAFGLSKTETAYALKNLVALKLIEKTKEGYSAADDYEIPSMPSEAIRKYHRQILKLAMESVDHQHFEKRDLRGHTLAFDQSRISEAKAFIEKFVTDFEKKFKTETPDSVYQLNTSLFRLDKEDL